MSTRLIPAYWFRWSSGVAMFPSDIAGMRRLMRKTRFRVAGESARERFVRLRGIIEAGARHKEERAP